MFNLESDGWLPTLRRSGAHGNEPMRSVLLESHLVADLALPAATLWPAVFRQVLLPVVVDALGFPRSRDQWQEWFGQGRFNDQQRDKIASYLDRHTAAFELFDISRPFAQVGGLESTNGETKPVTILMPTIATGNNVPLFTPIALHDEVALSPDQAALWLLHTHCWDTAAIKTGAAGDPKVKAGKTTGNHTGTLGQLGVIIPRGATLFETLILNMPIAPDGAPAEDKPQWRTDDAAGPQWQIRPARGTLDLLTWQSRRIRLIPEQTPDGVRVRRVIVSAGDRLESTPEYEPHTAWNYTTKPKRGQAQWRPRRHQAGTTAWQGMTALLSQSLPADGESVVTSLLLRQIADLAAVEALAPDTPLCLDTVGIEYGTQSAVVEDIIADSLPLPLAALIADDRIREYVLDAAQQAQSLADAINRLSADLRRAEGAEPLPWNKGQRPGITVLYALDDVMRRFLRGIQRSADDDALLEAGMCAWEASAKQHARQIASQLLAAASPATFTGRTVKVPGRTNTRTYRASTARRDFNRRLNEVLPRAAGN